MKLMVAGATTTIEELLPDPDIFPYLGGMITPNTGNNILRVCNWGIPYCLDNGCFDQDKFDPAKFVSLLYRAGEAPVKPVFAAIPDVVHQTPNGPIGDHTKTVQRFFLWVDKLLPLGAPLAFVAQDGLSDLDEIPWDLIDAVFIGGSNDFKDEMTIYISEACRDNGKWCHLGRVNGKSRLRLALLNDVDSVDGSSLSRFGKTWIPKFARDCKDLEQEASWLDAANERLEHEIRMWDLLTY